MRSWWRWTSFVVIASEAKQSISPSNERMDCFASLAMTEWMLSIRIGPLELAQQAVAALDG
jgi:hypothetical protein